MSYAPAAILAMSSTDKDQLQHNVQQETADLSSQSQHSFAAQVHTITLQDEGDALRLALVADNENELRQGLDEFDYSGLNTVFTDDGPKKTAFLFTGQGSQFINMGRQLFEHQPLFRATLMQCAELLTTHGIDLIAMLYPPLDDEDAQIQAAEQLNQTGNTQPALFALEYALATCWEAWGLTPSYLIGHSVGELAAATFAGVMSLEDGLTLISARARLMQAQPAGGTMAAMMASIDTVSALLEQLPQEQQAQLDIGGLNGPRQTVMSGSIPAIEAMLTLAKQQGIRGKQLTVSHAFHSYLMEPMLEEFGQIAHSLSYQAPRFPIISNVTGQMVTDASMNADYWQTHIRQPVNFTGGMATLAAQHCDTYIETGPQPILINMGSRCIDNAKEAQWLPSIRHDVRSQKQMFQSLAQLYMQGMDVDWTKVCAMD